MAIKKFTFEIELERLAELERKLDLIVQARRLNEHMRGKLCNRLSVIDAELYVHLHEDSRALARIENEQQSIWGISNSELQKLVQMFWGKHRVDSNNQVERGSQRAMRLNASEQRCCFINSHLSARQRCLILNAKGNPLTRVKAVFSRPAMHHTDPAFSVIDLVRCHVMVSVFGKEISLRHVYPWMNTGKMTLALQQLGKRQVTKTLEEMGVNVEELQQKISLCIQ